MSEFQKDISRSAFIVWLAGLSAAFWGFLKWLRSEPEAIPVGPDQNTGHELRNQKSIPVSPVTEKTEILIIGAGISGLSAARELLKAGASDFRILELEKNPGGNSVSGHNEYGSHPWGAHYLPLPSRDNIFVRDLLHEMKILRQDGTYDEKHLCHEPTERLFLYGQWQSGLFPQLGARDSDLVEWEKFETQMAGWRSRRGRDGKKVFAIPADLSSRDSEFLALDKITFGNWLRDRGFTSPRLLWFINYGMRDDYGSTAESISAWAGLHYFCSRPGEGDLVWPEGNYYLVKHLKQLVGDRLQTVMPVRRLELSRNRVVVTAGIAGNYRNYEARKVIYAAPKFILPYLVQQLSGEYSSALTKFSYAPWLVVNLKLKQKPALSGQEHWDNVFYEGDSLGYINGAHQNFGEPHLGRNYTWFKAFSGTDTRSERERLNQLSRKQVGEMVLRDMEKAHPDIREMTQELTFYKWGHAMIRPEAGFMTSPERRLFLRPYRNIYFAHSDISGLSLFEEAQYRGIMAARQALAVG